MTRPTLVRLAVFAATTVAAWGILAYGPDEEVFDDLQAGQVAQRDFDVVNPGLVTDPGAFEAAQQDARDSVEPIPVPRPEIEDQVLDEIDDFFASIADAVVREPVSTTTSTTSTTSTTIPETTTTTSPPDTTLAEGEETPPETTPPETTPPETTPTTIPPANVTVTGFLFVDADGDGTYSPDVPEDAESGTVGDVPIPMVGVTVTSDGLAVRSETQSDGSFSVAAVEGEVTVSVDQADPEYPPFSVSAGSLEQMLECSPESECVAEPVGLDPNLVPVDGVVAAISPDSAVADSAIVTLAAIAREDVVRMAVGGTSHLAEVQRQAIIHAQNLFGRRIFESAATDGIRLQEARVMATEQPPIVFYTDVNQRASEAGQAAGEVVSNFLLANWTFDEEATAAAAQVQFGAVRPEDYAVEFQQNQRIADEGEILTELDVAAIRQTGGVLERTQRQGGLLAVLTVLSAVLALYLNRFRPEFWAKPKMVALLGILIVLAAAAVRMTVYLEPSTGWYVMPAVVFGLMTTVLFDARIGVLMSLAVAIIAAVGTRDAGVAVYSLLATMAPIGFISSISTRRAFRNAAVYTALAAGGMAAATSWFFHLVPQDEAWAFVGTSAMWAVGVSLVAALIGFAGLQFFESAFDITTTLSLLDLTDRNHEALQLLQDRAFGTFNHSLMVGTLADAAARAIGADALLARASAYFHDLGKTEHPTMFIENQFGISNPHDEMDPLDSAEVIRRHVTDGVKLAEKFNIPTEVAEGIVSHHGDAVMRFFYEKARQQDPEVDVARFRHIGHKPRTAETAILMLADSLEASCRAVFQNEEPTPDAIEKVVNRVIDEKVNDGQLSESPLTLAQLTEVRKAFLGSLVGHYHQRIAYPNFPGS